MGSGWRCGERKVTCEERDVDRYGRIVAVCRAGREDLNAWMVERGFAVAYRRNSRAYVGEEGKWLLAVSAERGLHVLSLVRSRWGYLANLSL